VSQYSRRTTTSSQWAIVLFASVVVVSASGSQCNRRDPASLASYGPRVLTQTPTTTDILQVVNDNSAKIRSLYTTDATLTVPGAPSLRANLALERTKRLRLRAETAITGPEIDLGSNDQLFWLWIRRNPPPTVYYCRHEQFATSAAKQFIPIDPGWLLDAVGLASFDPALQHSVPERTAGGRWQIRTSMPTVQGTMTKLTVVDEARGWLLEQHLYDERNQLVASALTSRHMLDATSGAVVPQEIEVIWPATQFRLKFDVRQWTVNSIPADPNQLFSMPSVPGWNVVDLADPNLRMTAPNAQIMPSLPAGASGGSQVAASPMSPASPTAWSGGPAVAASPMGPMFAAPAGGSPLLGGTLGNVTQPGTSPGPVVSNSGVRRY
jgi:hypothetical protein